jgi:hypothetical protein
MIGGGMTVALVGGGGFMHRIGASAPGSRRRQLFS